LFQTFDDHITFQEIITLLKSFEHYGIIETFKFV
jgi:hypothetical protein